MRRPVQTSLLVAACAVNLSIGLAHAEGYWFSGSGEPVRSGSGECIKSGHWTPTPLVKGCDVFPPPPPAAPAPVKKPSRIVLLPDPSGKTGAVIVRGGGGEQLLNSAYAGLQAGDGGALQRSDETEASVRSRYGDVLDARSPRPITLVVRFESGSTSKLTPDSAAVIQELNKALSAWPAPQLMVVGHTDSVGSLQANDALSLKRAQTVVQLLIERGIPSSRIEAAGRGEREPLVPTADGVANAVNRRVEITLR